jgi:microsomal dipeptidase-like Zn-dependent dipeptidase
MLKKFVSGKLPLVLAALLITGLGVFFFVLPARVERGLNPVLQQPPYTVSPRAQELHKRLLVADLHADSLLWGRDLLTKSERGQVDVPRLIEGNVALQAFTLVSKTPRGLNIERNDDTTDNVFWLALAGRWPARTWFSLKERALYQASRLQQFAASSDGALAFIGSKKELADYLERRKTNPQITAGMLGIEGAQVLEGDPANVDAMFAAGCRFMAPSHFFDTEMGGSAHGVNKGRLTEKGRAMVRRMEALKMTVDVAHASPQTLDDVLQMSTRPVIVSHTGVKGACDNARNLSDQQLKALAAHGGLIGIGFWDTAVCGADAQAIARAIRHAVNVAGLENIALGSDYDGSVAAPFDVSGLALLTEALLNEGFDDDQIAKIMGGNALRFWAENLPEG